MIKSFYKFEEKENGPSVRKYEVRFRNETSETIFLRRLDAEVMLPVEKAKIKYFTSGWGAEFVPHEADIDENSCTSDPSGVFSIEVTAGRSGQGYIPWVGLGCGDKFYGIALAWSGSWLCEIGRDKQTGNIMVSMGISGEGFCAEVHPEGVFDSAAIYISGGRNEEEAGLEMRRYFRENLSPLRNGIPGAVPLEYNSWWAYEDSLINEDVLAENAFLAEEIGCSYAVMDAGWFGTESEGRDWYAKRGDWSVVNTDRFPSGIRALCDNIKRIGLLPGLWCEVEAVGKSADIRHERPELMAMRDGADLGYVCFGSEKTVEWALEVADKILGMYGARWIKFDFNLDPAPGCDRTEHGHGGGDGLVIHYRNYYKFLDILKAKYPDVVIENCSSGGLRPDIEMLSHTHWTHLSDPDHTELHLQCFWGALSYLHQSACLHFSWSDVMGGHNQGVNTPVTGDTSMARFDWMIRAVLMGVPGFSYKLPDWPHRFKERLKEHCDFYRSIYSKYILGGDIFRLTRQPLADGGGERFPVFELVSREKNAYLFAFSLTGSPDTKPVVLRGLEAGASYRLKWEDSGEEILAKGEELMRKGIIISSAGECTSEIIYVAKT